MAVSKVILNGTTLIDTTDKTVTAGSMLSGVTALKNDGTTATGSIASKSSTDLTANGATVTAPAGYYSAAASKSVATTTHPKPTASVNSTTGVVTASHTQTAGYVSAGTTTGTLELSTQAAKTVTPTTSSQTAVAAGKYTTGAVTVAAMPNGTAGTPTATKGTVSNNSVSITPSVTNATGYITGGTINGTAVTVSASELVRGTKSITENGTGIDVTNFASVDVAVESSGGTLGDVIVPSTVNEQTVYPDGSKRTIYLAGSSDSSPRYGWGFNLEVSDITDMAFYVPYEFSGELRLATSDGTKTSDISFGGIGYKTHDSSLALLFGHPFSFTGDELLKYVIFYSDNADKFFLRATAAGDYTATALSDVTRKEKGFRDVIVTQQFTDYASLSFSWDSSSLSVGDICAVSGCVKMVDSLGFDVRFEWDGASHSLDVMDGETLAGVVDISPTTVTFTNQVGSRNTTGGIAIAKYAEYDGLSSVTIQPVEAVS